ESGKGASAETRELAAAILLRERAEAVVVGRLFDPPRNQPQGGFAPAAVAGLAGPDADAGIQCLDAGVQGHARGQHAPFRTGMAQALPHRAEGLWSRLRRRG